MTIRDTLELSLDSQDTDLERFIRDFEASIGRYGCAIITDHDIDPTSVLSAATSFGTFCAEPETYKSQFHRPGESGYGLPRFSSESSSEPLGDLWQVDRTLIQQGSGAKTNPPYIWPDRPSDFRDSLVKLHTELGIAGEILLGMIARFLWLDRNWFVGPTSGNDGVLQLSKLPHLSRADPKTGILGLGDNIDLITLTFCTEDIECELCNRWDKSWNPVKLASGSMLITVGSMMRRLTNDILMPPTHRISPYSSIEKSATGNAIQFSTAFRSDFEIHILPECFGSAGNHYPIPITAGELKNKAMS